MITVKQEQYKNFGKCLSIKKDKTEIKVTLDAGPRIIYCSFNNHANVLWEDTQHKFTYTDTSIQKVYGKGTKWYALGGHRLWASPETSLTYDLDNEPVIYKRNGSVFTFLGTKQKRSGLQFELEINFTNSVNIKILHRIINVGKKTVTLAPWAITSFCKNSIAIFQQDHVDKGFLPNRHFSLWSYTKTQDPRLFMGNDYVSLRMDPNPKSQSFKIGFMSERAEAMCIVNQTQVKIKFPYGTNVEYPDYGCNFETYTNNLFLELEVLGNIVSLAPKKQTTLWEEWHLSEQKTKVTHRDEKILSKAFNA